MRPRVLSIGELKRMTSDQLADVVMAEVTAPRARGEPDSNSQRIAALLLLAWNGWTKAPHTVIDLAAARRRRHEGRR